MDSDTPQQIVRAAGPRTFDRVRELAEKLAREARREAEDPAYAEQRRQEREAMKHQALEDHREAQRTALHGYLLECGVGRREADAIFAGLSDDLARWPAVAAVRDFWQHPNMCLLLLTGGSGTGKSAAACEPFGLCRYGYHHPDFGDTWAYASRLRERPLYALAPVLASGDKYGPRFEKEMNKLVTVRYLVLDELGEETMTEPWLATLERVIGERHRAKRKTVLVTNLDGTKFRAHYGEKGSAESRIMRRIRTDGMVVSTGERRNPQISFT